MLVAGYDGSLELYDMMSDPDEVKIIYRPSHETNWDALDLHLFFSEDGSILAILSTRVELTEDAYVCLHLSTNHHI